MNGQPAHPRWGRHSCLPSKTSSSRTASPQRKHLRIITLVALAFSLSACDKEAPPPPGAKPGRLIGKLADAQGQPLSDVTVSITGFSAGGEPVTQSVYVRGPAASYELVLPDGKYNTPTARISVDYNEQRYVLPLASTDNSGEWLTQQDSKRGLVRDFAWRIRGAVPNGNPQEPAGFYGGTILFDKQGDLGDLAKLEVTLTPDGPLIDGTEGKPVVFERVVPWKRNDDHYLLDVPIGRYTVAVRQMFGSKPQPLRVTCFSIDPARPNPDLRTDRPASAATVEFECVEAKPGAYKLLHPNLTAYPPR